MKGTILITGGGRSGKSRYALNLANGYRKKVFIATAEPIDDEIKARIARHRSERGDGFKTIEESLHLAEAVKSANRLEAEIIVIDCLTMWINNLLYRYKSDSKIYHEIDAFIEVCLSPFCKTVVVANEIGMGIIPADPLTRLFMDIAGSVNQRLAVLAGEVIFMVSGIPMVIKPKTKD